MKGWLLHYWWLIWGILGSALYIWYRYKRDGNRFLLSRDTEKYSDKAIMKQLFIVAVGLVFILIEIVFIKIIGG